MSKQYTRDICWWVITMVTFLIFVVLKLARIIDWKWIWIVSPLWIVFLYLSLLIAVIALGMSIKEMIKSRKRVKEAVKKIKERIEANEYTKRYIAAHQRKE